MKTINILTDAFDLVLHKIWLIIVPVVLDLFLWFGPKLSIAPVVTQTVATLREMADSLAPNGYMDVQLSETFETLIEMMQTSAEQINLLSLLAWGALGVPSMSGGLGLAEMPGRIVEIAGAGQMIALQLVILAAGLLIACLFLGMLVQQVRDGVPNLPRLLSDAPTHWLYLALIFVPLGMIMIFGLSMSYVFGPLAMFVGVGLVWAALYLSFVPHAVIMDRLNPLQAMAASFALVRTNFWPTVRLLLLSYVIRGGLAMIWGRLLLTSTPGVVVAIAANAFVGTAIAVALFLFYRERMNVMRQLVMEQVGQQPPQSNV